MGNVGLAVTESTIADALKAGGYTTGIVGKWSMGTNDEYHPMRRGFDEFFGFLSMLHPYVPGPVEPGLEMVMAESPRPGFGVARPSGPTMPGWIGGSGPGSGAGYFLRGFDEVEETENATDAFTREAIEFMRRNQDSPFFLYLAYSASHSPLQPPQEYVEMYPDLEGKRQLYAATTTALDDAVGRFMEAMRELNLEEDTLIVFINDNGGPIDDIAADNSPLGGSKFQMWEGGIRVPMFVRWKGRVQENIVFEQPVISLDLFPTVLGATAQPKPDKELEGIDLLPTLLSGKEDPAEAERTLYWRDTGLWAIRKGKWKLTVPQSNVTTPLLFDLSVDAGENKDLAAENPEVVEELTDLWNNWNEQNKSAGGGIGARRGAARAGGGPAARGAGSRGLATPVPDN